MKKELKAVVLAAGKGTRLRTEGCDLPKVMREALGRPLLYYVLRALEDIPREDVILVVGYQKEQVTAGFPGYVFAEQAEQLGTGHAVLSAREALEGFEGAVLVCYGDMPLIRRDTYQALVEMHFREGNDCTMLTGTTDDNLPYGRIVRDADGCFERIVEDRDCTPAQRAITEMNSGVYVFSAPKLLSALRELRTDNAQGEYYLTDVPAIMRGKGEKIGICMRPLGQEIIGVNTVEQLHQVEEILAGMPRT